MFDVGIVSAPVIKTEPVNKWESSIESPKTVLPEENDWVKCDTEDEIINSLAVMLPSTIKFSEICTEPVIVAPLAATKRPFFTIN